MDHARRNILPILFPLSVMLFTFFVGIKTVAVEFSGTVIFKFIEPFSFFHELLIIPLTELCSPFQIIIVN
jgi:hypothetical protein